MRKPCAACSAHEKTIQILQDQLRYERTRNAEAEKRLVSCIPTVGGVATPVVPVRRMDADAVADNLMRVYDDVTGDYVDVPAEWADEDPIEVPEMPLEWDIGTEDDDE